MMKKNLITLIIGIFLSTLCQATISVKSKSWPKQLPPQEYGAQNYYGNAEADSFKTAITGKPPMTDTEQKKTTKLLPEVETNRWYIKGGIATGTEKLDKIQNKSTHNLLKDQKLYDTKFNKDIINYQFAIGYIWDNVRLDAEYLSLGKLKYNKNPLMQSFAGILKSTISSNHFLINLYYDSHDFFLFKPYLGITIGIGQNKALSTASNPGNGISKIKKVNDFNYGLDIGARVRIASTKFFVNANYRYLYLGKVKWLDSTETMALQGKKSFNGFCLGLMYLL